jgi:hypothetical protein
VIAICEAKQTDYEVNPKKLQVGDGIEANRNSFRVLFDNVITAMALSHETMPIGLIREALLIYAKVYDRSGDLARRILSDFLFLHCLLPAFAVPKRVGLPELIPDRRESRSRDLRHGKSDSSNTNPNSFTIS